MKIKPIFAWFDFYVGAFWDIKKRKLYIIPFPMIGIVLDFSASIPCYYCGDKKSAPRHSPYSSSCRGFSAQKDWREDYQHPPYTVDISKPPIYPPIEMDGMEVRPGFPNKEWLDNMGAWNKYIDEYWRAYYDR